VITSNHHLSNTALRSLVQHYIACYRVRTVSQQAVTAVGTQITSLGILLTAHRFRGAKEKQHEQLDIQQIEKHVLKLVLFSFLLKIHQRIHQLIISNMALHRFSFSHFIYLHGFDEGDARPACHSRHAMDIASRGHHMCRQLAALVHSK
jgi:hypothetical protein